MGRWRPVGGLSRWEPGACHVDEAAGLRGRNRPVAAFESGGRRTSDRSSFFQRRGLLGCGRLCRWLL